MSENEQNLSPHIVVIGGGTGSYTLLNSLKHLTPNITAIPSMADDGGSTGELRDELGVLPPGDLRQCIAALSPSEEVRQILSYRYPEGKYKGHSMGNFIVSGTELMANGDIDEAAAILCRAFNTTGQVIPVTKDKIKLVTTLANGQKIIGESRLGEDTTPSLKGVNIGFDVKARLNPRAAKAISRADMIVIAPGNLYRSILPALAVEGMSEALKSTKAKVVYVCNLVNKQRHTFGFSVDTYVSEIERILKYKAVQFVLYNTEAPAADVLNRYKADKELPVAYDKDVLDSMHYETIGANLLSKQLPPRTDNDPIANRSLIRHNQEAIAKQLMHVYFKPA